MSLMSSVFLYYTSFHFHTKHFARDQDAQKKYEETCKIHILKMKKGYYIPY